MTLMPLTRWAEGKSIVGQLLIVAKGLKSVGGLEKPRSAGARLLSALWRISGIFSDYGPLAYVDNGEWPGRRRRTIGKKTTWIISYGTMCGTITMLVISHGGQNAAPVEVALAAKSHGLFVVALTSLHTHRERAATHSSGKKIGDIAGQHPEKWGSHHKVRSIQSHTFQRSILPRHGSRINRRFSRAIRGLQGVESCGPRDVCDHGESRGKGTSMRIALYPDSCYQGFVKIRRYYRGR